MKVLITGSSGYIATQLSAFLEKNNYEVYKLTTKKECLKERIFHYDGSYPSILKALNKSRPNVVLHLASYRGIENDHKEVPHLLEANLKLGTYLLEAMLETQIEYFINTASYSEYGDEKIKSPINLYAASKKSFQNFLEYYTAFKRIKALTLVLYDTYGPNDPRKKLINTLMAPDNQKKEILLTKGEQKIYFTYIEDVCNGFLRAIDVLLSQEKSYQVFALRGEEIVLKELGLMGSYDSTLLKWGALPYPLGQIFEPIKTIPILPNWTQRISLKEGLNQLRDKKTSN